MARYEFQFGRCFRTGVDVSDWSNDLSIVLRCMVSLFFADNRYTPCGTGETIALSIPHLADCMLLERNKWTEIDKNDDRV